MNSEKIYLTFPTDKATAKLLTTIAHMYGMTQPELINDLCKNHIKAVIKEIENYTKNST